MREFEFDPAKSVANLAKHGIDFTAAQFIWRDAHRIEVPARTTDEPRWMVIGQIGSRCWSAVVTYRDEDLRIISVRPSRESEVALYEG
ncbi:MAG: BrnT family toxin [Mycobacterium sp.]